MYSTSLPCTDFISCFESSHRERERDKRKKEREKEGKFWKGWFIENRNMEMFITGSRELGTRLLTAERRKKFFFLLCFCFLLLSAYFLSKTQSIYLKAFPTLDGLRWNFAFLYTVLGKGLRIETLSAKVYRHNRIEFPFTLTKVEFFNATLFLSVKRTNTREFNTYSRPSPRRFSLQRADLCQRGGGEEWGEAPKQLFLAHKAKTREGKKGKGGKDYPPWVTPGPLHPPPPPSQPPSSLACCCYCSCEVSS